LRRLHVAARHDLGEGRNQQRINPLLSLLSVLTTVVGTAVLVRIGLEEALLPKPPHGPYDS
jgi:hypothetical protein